MSRFWAGAESSEEDSSSESEDYSSDEDVGGGGAGGGAGGGTGGGANRWVDFSDSDSSEDDVRVAKSAKDRALDAFTAHIKVLRQHMKERDYHEIQNEFDALAKDMIKAKKTLSEGVPRSLVKILCDLEDYINERQADRAAFRKLSARQGRALNRMKLTLKKHNKPYHVVMEHYRKNPDNAEDNDDDEDDKVDGDAIDDSDSDDSSSSSSGSSSSSSSSTSDSGSKKKKKDSDDDDDNDDDDDDKDSDSGSGEGNSDDSDVDWNHDDDDSSSSSDSDAGVELKGRARWLKKKPAVTKKMKNKTDKPKAGGAEKSKGSIGVLSKDHESLRAPKSVLPEEGLTAALLNKKVQEIASLRGRKGTDPRFLLRQLEGLSRLSIQFGPRVEVPILMYVISAQFGLQRSIDDYMDSPTWRACASYLERITGVLAEGYKLGVQTVDEADLITKTATKLTAAASTGGAMAAFAAEQKLVNPHTGETETEDERAERLRAETEASMTEEEKKTIPVVGSLSMYLSSLEQEYTKALQKASHHTPEYVSRLRDEAKLVLLLAQGQEYFERVNKHKEAAALAQLRVEHLYYRHDTIAKQVDKAAAFYQQYGEIEMMHPACVSETAGSSRDVKVSHPAASSGKPTLPDDSEQTTDWASLIHRLCTYVYQYGSASARTRAIICHVFHHALHDRYLEGRDLLLMSHLQENIYDVGDVSTMILFNRMMVTLGMCAFRQGRVWDAHQCLSEVCSGRSRELLAQGVSMGRFNEKTPEQEKAEKRRQVPFHQHINLDLLEACHLISAMLLEVPNMAAASVGEGANTRRSRPISRTFRKYHDMYNHQVFTGPPEQTRDYVMRASKALMTGDWKACIELCTGLDVWNLVPGDNSVSTIQKMLREHIKLEGLRTYLFAFSNQYESLSLSQLCGMFEMTKNEVHSIVSKMMIHRELFGSWDQPTETIVLRKVEPNNLQVMALQFAEKAANLVEANERLLDAIAGNHGYREDWKNDEEGRHQHRGGHQGGNRGNSSNNNNNNNRGFKNPGGGRGGRGGGRQNRRGGGSGGGGGGGSGGRGGPNQNNRRGGGGGGREGGRKY